MAQVGQLMAVELAWRATRQLGRKRLHHLDVAGGAEVWGEHQRVAARLVQGVFQLVEAVARIDVDQYRADLGRGILRNRPLGVGRRPDANTITLLDAKRHETSCEATHLILKLTPGIAQALVARDERVTVREPRDGAIKRVTDSHAKQWRLACATDIAPADGATVSDVGMMLGLCLCHRAYLRCHRAAHSRGNICQGWIARARERIRAIMRSVLHGVCYTPEGSRVSGSPGPWLTAKTGIL